MWQMHDTQYKTTYKLYDYNQEKFLWEGVATSLLSKYYREMSRGFTSTRYVLENGKFTRSTSVLHFYHDIFTYGRNLPSHLVFFSEDNYGYQTVLNPLKFIEDNNLIDHYNSRARYKKERAYETNYYRKVPISGTGGRRYGGYYRNQRNPGTRKQLSEMSEQYGEVREYYTNHNKRAKGLRDRWDWEKSRSNACSHSWKNQKINYQWQKNLK